MQHSQPDRPVDGHPFRAHVRHVSNASGVPWPELVLAAGVPLAVGDRLMRADLPTITAEHASSLLSLSPERARGFASSWVPSAPATAHVRRLLRTGWTPVRLARGLHLPGHEVAALVAGRQRHVTRLVDLRVAVLASRSARSRSAGVRAA